MMMEIKIISISVTRVFSDFSKVATIHISATNTSWYDTSRGWVTASIDATKDNPRNTKITVFLDSLRTTVSFWSATSVNFPVKTEVIADKGLITVFLKTFNRELKKTLIVDVFDGICFIKSKNTD